MFLNMTGLTAKMKKESSDITEQAKGGSGEGWRGGTWAFFWL